MKLFHVRHLVSLSEESPPDEMLPWIKKINAAGWHNTPSAHGTENHYNFMYYAARLLARPGTCILELGRYVGVSTRFLREGMGNSGFLLSVDVDDSNRDTIVCPNDALVGVFECDSLDPRIGVATSSSPISILLIDSDHSYDRAMAEFVLYEPMVMDGGLILIDDVDTPPLEKMFDELDINKEIYTKLHSSGFGIYVKG